MELITGTISLEWKKKMLIGSFYRPPDKTDTYRNKKATKRQERLTRKKTWTGTRD